MQSLSLTKPWTTCSKMLLFTGQGSQFIGMGKDFIIQYPYTHYIYDEVDEAVRFNLSKTMFNGDQKDLLDTRKVQPAILAHAAAILDILNHEYDFKIENSNIKSIAGHSVGEFVSLYASKCLNLYDAAKLLKFRGDLIHTITSCEEECGMLALLFGDPLKIENLSKEITQKSSYIVDVANRNSPKQIVLSGHKEALLIVDSLSIEKKYCKKTKFLDIPYPFHSSILNPCYPILKEYFKSIPLKDASIPILSNYTSKPMKLKSEIKQNCSLQINHSVLWEQSIRSIYKDIDLFIEIGPKSILIPFNKQIHKEIQSISICDTKDIKELKLYL